MRKDILYRFAIYRLRFARFAVFATAALVFLAGTAEAFPPVIFYTYTPPVPQLAVVNLAPADHQEFSASPGTVSVSFSQAIVPEKSTLNVFDPYNNLIASRGKMARDTAMEAPLPPHLLAGTYRVEWSATCACAGNQAITGTSYFAID